jgi:alkyldihydroxyacetonephosphate synthase
MTVPPLGPGAPTPPIPLTGDPLAAPARLGAPAVIVGDDVVGRLRGTGAQVSTEVETRTEASRDWWPLAMAWAAAGQLGAVAGAVVRPGSPEQVPEILRICHDARMPVVPTGGRSGVCGGTVPVHGGVALDLCGLVGIRHVDDE